MNALSVVRRVLVIALVLIALAYVSATTALYAAMRQTPENFGAVMARVPPIAMAVLPFKPLWMQARAGQLRVGDRAPDFSLRQLHGEGRVTLSQQYPSRPVVLVFGSYT